MEKADASAVLKVKNAVAQTAKRMRMLTSSENLSTTSNPMVGRVHRPGEGCAGSMRAAGEESQAAGV
jgi:hypothetical protein